MRRLGIVFCALILATMGSLARAEASESAKLGPNVKVKNGKWYCFGKKATIIGERDGVRHEPHEDSDEEEQYVSYDIVGTDGDDVIIGTRESDTIRSGNGKDWICSLEGADFIEAPAKRVHIDGGAGNDNILAYSSVPRSDSSAVLYGGPGNDVLVGGSGADRLYGQQGTDSLNGSGGFDRCIGGQGDDRYRKCERR